MRGGHYTAFIIPREIELIMPVLFLPSKDILATNECTSGSEAHYCKHTFSEMRKFIVFSAYWRLFGRNYVRNYKTFLPKCVSSSR